MVGAVWIGVVGVAGRGDIAAIAAIGHHMALAAYTTEVVGIESIWAG